MNIYDELSIKWDGIKGRINTAYVGYDYDYDYDITYDVQLTDIMEDDEIKLFDNFIERAKKVEELKDLYSHLSYIRLCLFCETDTDVGQNIMNKDEAINKKIKILEKELEAFEWL